MNSIPIHGAPIHGSRIGSDVDLDESVQIPRVRFQVQPREEEQRPAKIRDRVRDPQGTFRLCDDKECVSVHISPLVMPIRENYSSSGSQYIGLYIALAVVFLVVVYMAFNNVYPFRFFENLMFF